MSNPKYLKKLARSGWRQGKHYKKESNRDIRNFQDEDENPSFDEVYLEMRGINPESFIVDEWSDDTQVVKIKKKVPRFEKEIKKHILKVRHAIKLSKGDISYLISNSNLGGWTQSYYMSTYNDYIKSKEALTKYLEKDISNKLKKQIREVLG